MLWLCILTITLSFLLCQIVIWNRYHELEIEKSLRDNLNYKTIIEYPVLHVVLRDHWTEYPPKGPGNASYLFPLFSLNINKGVNLQYDKSENAAISNFPALPRIQQHCIMSCFLQLRLSDSVALFFTMATHNPNRNERVLLTITHTNLTSTGSVSKKRIKHGLLFNSDLMGWETTADEKTRDQPVFSLAYLSVSSSGWCLG